MTALLVMPASVRFLLGVDDPAVLTRALQRADVGRDALTGRLRGVAGRVLDERVARVLHGLLDIDLGGLVLDGWAERADLAAAVVGTGLGRVSATEVAPPDHRITSTRHPAVDVLAGGTEVAALRFDLTVSLRLRGVVVQVRDGLLTSLVGGQLVAAAELSREGRVLLSGIGRGPLAPVLRLGAGAPLPDPPAPDPPARVLPWPRRADAEDP
ncbi:MAG TPA: hypothetical protein VEZ42_22375 [Pseudonocardia sp.]|nr:hypothetical protein [Pseudonocardia sp.]